MFEIRLVTATYAPPHVVSLMTPLNGWHNIDGSYTDGHWAFSLDEARVWTQPGYFKFLLDDRYWMDDPYIRLAPVAGETYTFDEGTVTFMTTIPQAATPPGPDPTPPRAPAPPPVAPPQFPPISEGAAINRVVLILTPFFTAGAAWIAGLLARHVPGVTLDQTQVVSFMIAIVAVCLAGAWKWLQGWQQHELLVAQKLAAPIKPVLAAFPMLTPVLPPTPPQR